MKPITRWCHRPASSRLRKPLRLPPRCAQRRIDLRSVRYWLIMPAAGSGRRFGSAVPKQYLDLAGRSVIEHSLAPFIADSRCVQIVVALDPDDSHFRGLPLAADPRIRFVQGGAQRCDSVRNAITTVAAADDDWVLVHDAARPFLS